MSETKAPILSNTAYDVAKDVISIWLPAIATLYASLAIILGWPWTEEVVAIIGVVVIFLGTVLKRSSTQYANKPVDYNGTLTVNHTDPMTETHRLEIDQPWDELGKLNEVRIQVIDESDPLHVDGRG